jgi:hypothetical protein
MVKKTFPLDLDEDLHRRLKHAAIDAGLTLQAFILRVLEEHVDHNGIPAPNGGKRNDRRPHHGR